jgi:hypothetical protein
MPERERGGQLTVPPPLAAVSRPSRPVTYLQLGLVMMGLASVPKKRAVGPLYWAPPPNVLPLVIWPNSQTQRPPTLACRLNPLQAISP